MTASRRLRAKKQKRRIALMLREECIRKWGPSWNHVCPQLTRTRVKVALLVVMLEFPVMQPLM